MTALPEETLSRALACARRGWPVFPCRPGGKEPATRHGFRDASTDPDQVRRWWERQPTANLAIATGLPGPDVLDVDQHGASGNGFTALRQLKAAGLLDRAGPIVATPNGGLHLYFVGSTQPSGRLPRRHLDFKAAGGYVLVPPSEVGGRSYRLLARGEDPARLDWPTITRLLEPERHHPRKGDQASLADPDRLAGWVERLPEGNRNSGLYWAVCRAVEAGWPTCLDELAAAAVRTGLGDREIARTIASARRAARADPEHQPEREGAR